MFDFAGKKPIWDLWSTFSKTACPNSLWKKLRTLKLQASYQLHKLRSQLRGLFFIWVFRIFVASVVLCYCYSKGKNSEFLRSLNIKWVLKRFKIKVLTKGTSHSTQIPAKSNGMDNCSSTRPEYLGSSVKVVRRPVWTFRPDRPKCPFPFYKTLVPSIVFVSCLQEK